MKILFQEGKGGQPKVRVESRDGSTSCEIYYWGATVTSWISEGKERLFVSDLSIFNGVKAIRGGIPVVFPQFAQPIQTMPQHGFARISNWTLKSSDCENESCCLVFSLSPTAYSESVWPHPFLLEYHVNISRTQLSCTLQVHNVGDADFDCHTLLHTYIRVNNVADIEVRGFHQHNYIDKLRAGEIVEEANEIIRIDREVDRVYLDRRDHAQELGDVRVESTENGVCNSITVTSSAQIEAQDGSLTCHPCDIVFWNPWIDKARSLADLGEAAFPTFVCVEPGTVANWVTLTPRSTLHLQQTLTACDRDDHCHPHK